MKVSSYIYTAAICLASAIGVSASSSFKNTAPMLVSSDLLSDGNTDYVTTFEKSNEKISTIIEGVISEGSNVVFMKISGLDESDIDSEFLTSTNLNDLSFISNHVIYNEVKEIHILPNVSTCKDVFFAVFHDSTPDIVSLKSAVENKNFSFYIINLIKNDELIDNLLQISEIFKNSKIIIQGVPDFIEPKLKSNTFSTLKSIITQKKRDNLDYDKIEEELIESFEEINLLLDDDQLVEAYEDEKDINLSFSSASSKQRKSNPNVVDGSLFDKYGFFSTGIWMGTIVFLFLTWLLSIALSWLSSMQISYGAFEKPIDFEKKLQ